MKRVILSFATLGMLAVGANALTQDDMGCYQIGTSAELFEFAGIVNADEGADKSACGILTADITVNENVLTDYSLNGTPATVWTPLAYYHGVFDGKHHTISGLYATGTQEVGFFGALANGKAVVRNLNIADSYFAVDSYMAGGITGNLWDVEAIIDSCSFDGVVTMTGEDANYGNDLGGIVGNVSYNSTLVVSNTTNKGKVGYGSTGWNMGTIVGLTQENGDSVSVVTSLNNTNTGSLTNGSTKTMGSTAGTITESTSATAAEITAAYGDLLRLYSVTTPVDYGTFSGVKLSYANNKLIATLVDSVATLSISNDLAVDSVCVARTFTANAYSTITLPFAVDVDSVNGTFADFKSVNEDFTEATGEHVTTSLTAYRPYMLTPDGTELNISGAVTLKASAEVSDTVSVDNWKFIGTLAKKRWQAVCTDDASKCENASEVEQGIYGFVGTAVENKYTIGNFVKVANKISVRPMRAFLLYTGAVAEAKPSASGMSMAPALVELPDTMKVIIVEPVVEEVEEPVAEETDPAETPEVEGTDAIKATKAPAIIKQDRYFDMTGRSLKTIKAQGAYINNRTPVIAK